MTIIDDLDVRYLFSITAPFATRWVGKTPAGYRIDLDYASDTTHRAGGGGPRVTTDIEKLRESWPNLNASVDAILARPDEDAPGDKPDHAKRHPRGSGDDQKLERARDRANEKDHAACWFGLSGTVAAGMDWAQLRPDGVVDFDGRLTLRDEQGALINAVVLGSVDLVKGDERPLTLDEAVERLRGGEPDKVGFALALRFEAAQEPEPWAAKRYRRARALKYRRLSQGQCLGVGRLVSFADAASCFVIDVVSVLPKPAAIDNFGHATDGR
jgi:hypothetical protein